MKPYYDEGEIQIFHGDCREVLPKLDPVETCVTDPPYGLEFMGEGWDRGIPGVEFWRIILDALLPGASCLAFGGTRTFHRLTCAIKDAGFQIRDCLMWLYGSGFPKSLDISKAIDKAADYRFKSEVRRAAVSSVESAGLKLPSNNRWDWTVGEHAPGDKWWAQFQSWLPNLTDQEREKVERGIVERVKKKAGWFTRRDIYDITAPATNAAKTWEGWGTALKPAWEPIVLAMKPLDGSFAENAQKHGVAGINVDGSRIGVGQGGTREGERSAGNSYREKGGTNFTGKPGPRGGDAKGRFPANVVLDEEAAKMLDEQSLAGEMHSAGKQRADTRPKGYSGKGMFPMETKGSPRFGDSGGASRFFYTAKASNGERNDGYGVDNIHPTVKPLDLMRYLCTLTATPTGGTVLDPFMGSGSTLVAARSVGRKAIGIEVEEKYIEIAIKRLAQGLLF